MEGALLGTLVLLSAIILKTSAVCPSAYSLYPYGEDVGDVKNLRGDDGPSREINLSTDFIFFGTAQNVLYINTNGHISFGSSYTGYRPKNTSTSNPPFVGPYFNDITLISPLGYVTPGEIYSQASSDPDLLAKTSLDLLIAGYADVNPTEVVVATWENVTHIGNSPDMLENTFQVVLASDGTESFIMFNYGHLEWNIVKNRPSVAILNRGDNTGDVVNIGASYTPEMTSMNKRGNSLLYTGRYVMKTDPETIVYKPDVCVCRVYKNATVQTFDGEILLILGEQKTLLSRTRDITSPCRFMFKIKSQLDDELDMNVKYSTSSFGIHPKNKNKFWKNVAIERFHEGVVEVRGHHSNAANGGAVVELPKTITSSDNLTKILIVGDGDSGYSVVGLNCPYSLTYQPRCDDIVLLLHVSSDFTQSQTLRGICHDCDGNIGNDKSTCQIPRVDVSAEPDYAQIISDSCNFT